MAGETIITVVGNLTADPELRYTPSGVAVANLSIAANHRVKNGDQWEDGEPTYYRATVWREYAEYVAESLTKGTQVLAHGRVFTEAYTTKEGEQRTSLKLDIEDIGPCLRFATAKVTKAQRGGGTTTTQPQQSAPQQWGQAPAQSDPWQGAPSGQQGAWPSEPANSEPPF